MLLPFHCDSVHQLLGLLIIFLLTRLRGSLVSQRSRKKMSSVFSFQAQLLSIMDALSKTAVTEISKLVEIESKMLKIEITRGRNEIASLTEKLQLMEKLLYMAQGNRQEVVLPTAARDSTCLASDRTRPLRKSMANSSETVWEKRNSSPETTRFYHSENHTATESEKELPELRVIKEEPPDLDNSYTDQDQTAEIGVEAFTDIQKSPEVTQNTKPTVEHHQPVFTDDIMTLSQPSLPKPWSTETHWSSQLPAAKTNPGDGESVAQNVQSVASQSISVLRNTKLHNYRNSVTKRFGCLHCGKSFRCFSQLEIHQRSHTGEKPFRCTLCGKRYAQKGHLYTHQRTHTGEKPYRCPVCGKGFIQKCTLDMHQRTHTGEKPFVCVKCGKGFTKNCNLKKHLSVHLDPCLNIYGSEPRASALSGAFLNGAS